MNYWLVKSEPNTWSWNDQWTAPKRTTHWDGVRNHQAANFMRDMKKGDRAFFYHSGKERAIVGVVEITKEAYPDPSDDTGRTGKGFVMVNVKAIEPVDPPVTLAQIKDEPKLNDMVLVNNSRLSVQPVTAAQWKVVSKMAGLKS